MSSGDGSNGENASSKWGRSRKLWRHICDLLFDWSDPERRRKLWLYIPAFVGFLLLVALVWLLASSWPPPLAPTNPALVPINPALVPINYGKLAEQYGSFLVAIGGVSITVLALVMYLWHLDKVEDYLTMHHRSTVIKALIVSTFCSFVGAHLLAETAAFIRGNELHDKGFGARQFLLASVNIFVAVPVVMFAVTVLATEYRKRQKLLGLRILSSGVFTAAVFCVLWWMIVSIFFRMPPPNKALLVYFVGAIAVAALVLFLSLTNKPKKMASLLNITFELIALSSVGSLILCSLALYTTGDDVGFWEAIFFVITVTFTCLALLIQGPPIAKEPPGDFISTLQQCQ
jgi:hypothetical protein